MGTIEGYVKDTLRRQAGQDPGVVRTHQDGVSIEVDVEATERYASGVRGITVRPDQPVDTVRDVADRIVKQVDALDPLTVVECDDQQGHAIVRSANPEQADDGVTYWEADVQGEETSLHRYHKSHTAPEREQIAEPLMHPTVGRVAEQLADAVRQ